MYLYILNKNTVLELKKTRFQRQIDFHSFEGGSCISNASYKVYKFFKINLILVNTAVVGLFCLATVNNSIANNTFEFHHFVCVVYSCFTSS